MITVMEYKYGVGDLIKFRIYNGNTARREESIGMVVKRQVQQCFWYEEAERRVYHSGRDFLLYEVVHESQTYTVKEDEILGLISSNTSDPS